MKQTRIVPLPACLVVALVFSLGVEAEEPSPASALAPAIFPLDVPTEEATHRLVWTSKSGRQYSVDDSDSLTAWTEVDGSPFTANGTTMELPFRAGQDARFFRIRVHEDPAIPGFSLIPAGSFGMGSPEEEAGRWENEEPSHQVTLTRSFFMKQTEVTWQEWNAARERQAEFGYANLPPGAAGFGGDESHPVTQIGWWDAVIWCNLSSEIAGREPVYYITREFTNEHVLRVGTTGALEVNWQANGFRLPTEAEWEYACRAGTTTAFYSGPIIHPEVSPLDPNLDLTGWYGGNAEFSTHPVGIKAANSWGLFDTHGNVSEWCWDWVGPYAVGDVIDPRGPASGTERAIRGGAFFNSAARCRSAARTSLPPSNSSLNIGFRTVAREAR